MFETTEGIGDGYERGANNSRLEGGQEERQTQSSFVLVVTTERYRERRCEDMWGMCK